MKAASKRDITISVLIIVTFLLSATATYLWFSRPAPTVESPITPVVPKNQPLPTVDSLLSLVNAERAKVNVAPLVIDNRLNQSAQAKADDMNVNNYFGHMDKNGKHGYSYIQEFAPNACSESGENITDNVTKGDNSSARAVYSWIHSPPHYAAMIDPNNSLTGFGISGTKIVEHFCQQ